MFALAACALLSVSCGGLAPREAPLPSVEAGKPALKRVGTSEFRGLWVATVSNIDWPSRPGLPAEESKAEALRLLDLAVSLNLNAVLLQVRPASDALYESAYEPVSSFLTGAQGVKPADWYDPLAFWLEQAQARGLELHAWINPFRAGTPSVRDYAPQSPVRSRPDLARRLGERGWYWLDPGLPEARAYVLAVAADLLRRYALDGLAVDDYIYPYPEYLDPGADFPDEESYERWRILRDAGSDGPERRPVDKKSAFRRESATAFLRALGKTVGEIRPGARFGISPFGIWKPGRPPGVVGKDAREELFADSRLWLRELDIGYLAPQLYWPASQTGQSFPLLLGWWLAQSTGGVPIWPSIRAASPSLPRELRAPEAVNQIMTVREMEPDAPGFLLYGARYLLEDADGVARALREGPLAAPADR